MKHWVGHGHPWAYRIRITQQTSNDWRQLVPNFPHIFSPTFPNPLVSPTRSMSMQACFIGYKVAFALGLYLWEGSRLPFAVSFPNIACYYFDLSQYKHQIIYACRALNIIHLHQIVPIDLQFFIAWWKNKCQPRSEEWANCLLHEMFLVRIIGSRKKLLILKSFSLRSFKVSIFFSRLRIGLLTYLRAVATSLRQIQTIPLALPSQQQTNVRQWMGMRES